MIYTLAIRNRSRRRYDKFSGIIEKGTMFVAMRGRPSRQVFRNLTVKKRHGRRAMSHLFQISKPMKKYIKGVLSGFNK